MFLALAKHLPAIAHDEPNTPPDKLGMLTGSAVSLIDLLPNVGPIIDEMLLPLQSEEIRKLGLLQDLRKQLDTNVAAAKRPASQYDGTSRQTVQTYFTSTPLLAI